MEGFYASHSFHNVPFKRVYYKNKTRFKGDIMTVNDFKIQYGKKWLERYEDYLLTRRKYERKLTMKKNVVKKNLRYFITITFKPEKATYKKNNDKMKKFFQRHNIDYYLIMEYHESGFIHYHGFVNLPESDLIVKKIGKYGFIYTTNYFEKTCGFTYITKLNGNLSRAVNYCLKYITKSNVSDRAITNNKSNMTSYLLKDFEENFKNLLTYEI